MNNPISIPAYAIYYLEDLNVRDEFIDGLIAISRGIEPETASKGFIDEAWSDIGKGLTQQKTLKGLPPYDDNGKLSGAWKERYDKVSKGWLPLNLQDNCSVKGLKFVNITTARIS